MRPFSLCFRRSQVYLSLVEYPCDLLLDSNQLMHAGVIVGVILIRLEDGTLVHGHVGLGIPFEIEANPVAILSDPVQPIQSPR